MYLDITEEIPRDSVITRQTLKKYNASSRSAGHLLLEVISRLPYDAAMSIQTRLPDNQEEQAEMWERYRERIAIMAESKDEPTDEQIIIALRDALYPIDYPDTDIYARQKPEITRINQEEKITMEQDQEQMELRPVAPADQIVLRQYGDYDDSVIYEEPDEAAKLQTEFMRKAMSKKHFEPGEAMRVIRALAERNKRLGRNIGDE